VIPSCPDPHDHLDRHFSAFAEPVPAILDTLPRSGPAHRSTIGEVTLDSWVRGCVVLVERLDAQQGPLVIQRGGDMDLEMRVDTTGDPRWQGGHRHPFVGKRVGWHHTPERRTGQRRASTTGS
jgi:hypothetical protein